MNISQSLYKAFRNYQKGLECGILFEAMYVKKEVSLPTSEVQAAGNWFEYIATGEVLRNGEIPIAGLTKTAAKSQTKIDNWHEWCQEASESEKIPDIMFENEKDLLSPYKNLLYQADHLKKSFLHYGIEVIETGKEILIDRGEYKDKGIIDVHAIIHKMPDVQGIGFEKPFEAYLDIKSTGLLEDKWTDYGWNLESLKYKHNLMTQPVFYKHLGNKSGAGENIPFYFFVHSTTNVIERKIIEIRCSDELVEAMNTNTLEMYEDIQKELTFFTPRGSVKKCFECPVDDCNYKVEVPIVNIIELEDLY